MKTKLSGDRFSVTYSLQGSEQQAYNLANYICIEQTVEFPQELITSQTILQHIVGRLEKFEPNGTNKYRVEISYAVECTAFELNQFLSVIFGNISLKPGILVERFDLHPSMLEYFPGPRFGVEGWREHLDIHNRAFLCTAIKPMGLDTVQLAEMAYKFALGGIDIIKDDHGLTNQNFSPYEERVQRCVEAVEKANKETGKRSIYVPNISAPHHSIFSRAEFAHKNGAGGLLICPGITGFSAMHQLSMDKSITLPIMSHPTFSGANLTNPQHGFSYYCYFGQLQRMAGADASIHASYKGRFAFTREQCQQVNKGCTDNMGGIKSILPTPGGGMSIENISQLHEFYGNDVIYLIGGGLHKHSPDLIQNARDFLKMVKKAETP